MLQGLKIGNVIIPILDDYYVEGSPSFATNPYQLPSSEKMPTSNVDVENWYNAKYAGAFKYYDNYAKTAQDNSHEARNVNNISNGNTDLHGGVGGASFYLNDPEISGGATHPVPSYRWAGLYMTGTNVDYTQTAFLSSSGIPNWPSANGSYMKEGKVFAVRIHYSDPSVDYYNYQLIQMRYEVTRTLTNRTENYTISNANSVINMYYWRYRNIEAYYEEVDLPDEDDDPNEQDPDYPSGPSDPDPDHTIIMNPIPIPNLPSMGSATAGFLTMYKLSLSTIQQFATDMFASSIWEAIKLFFTNPMDFLVGCMLLPFEPSTGSSYYPKFGIFTFEHSYPAVDNQYKEIDCGYVDVKKFWGSCFDYEPFTKLQIWLPYIGYRDIPTDEFMGEQLHVVYHCDCLTGDCVAFITTTNSVPGQSGPNIARVLAQYYGNCGVRVPFSSVNFDAAVAAGINLIGAAASMGLSKGAGGVALNGSVSGNVGSHPSSSGVVGMSIDEGYSEPSGAGLAGATINAVESMKPTVQKGGAAGASNGYMSIQKPYLIKRIPRQSLPEGYARHKGYPSNIGGTLSQFSGYAEVDDIQLNNIPAMETERKEILSWLAGGVLI